ncbi:MAG: Fe(3+) dicitrate transport protein FecA precursor [Pseudomonadota bacterium]|jgi:iron complex outermembrane receptor protein
MLSKKYIFCVGASVLMALPVCAQNLEGVVVSASRAEQRSFDAPASIQSVERDVIQDGGPQVNLSESLNRVPGLTILNRQNYAQDLQVSIRGFGARTAFGIRGVRLLIDGIPATTPDGQGQGSSISLPSTERIEVLRGPLAQLYGNSAGGVIQAFTREAPEVPELIYQYYGGSFGMHRNDLQYAGKSGKVGIVADYSTFDTNGYRDNSTTQRKQFNGKLSFGPDEKTRVNLVFNQFDMPLAQDPAGLTASQLAANPQQAGSSTVSTRTRKIVFQNQVGSTLMHQLDDSRSISARAYFGTRDNTQYQSTDKWVGLNRAFYGLGIQYNEKFNLASIPVRWAAGYEFDRSREYRQGGAASLGEKTSTTRSEDNQAESSDLFAQATAMVSEQFSLTGGARYSTVRMLSEDYYLSDGSNGSGNISYSSVNPVLGVTWHANDNLNIYANYGKGFETPTLAEMAYNGSSSPSFNTSIGAASSQHYELGAKWIPSPRSRVDFTLFQINTTDEIVIASNSSGISTYKNAPGTSRLGWEFAFRSLLTENLRAQVSASAIDAQFTQTFSSYRSSTAITVNSGNKIPGIPQQFLFAELNWAQNGASINRRKPTVGLQGGVEAISAGRLYADDTNAASADGYTTFNLKASHGWAVGKGSLTAYARADNVTDQRYVGSVIVNQSSQQYYEPAPGYNWTLGLRLSLPL